MDGSRTNDIKAKIFRRELITALMFYFPVMIIDNCWKHINAPRCAD